MNEQQIREAILDVIDAGDPRRTTHREFDFYSPDEAWANEQRLRFCDAVIAKLKASSEGGIVYGMGPIDNTPAANMIPVDDVLSQSFRQTDFESA